MPVTERRRGLADLAFIYDRAGSDADALKQRLLACSEYARGRGWEIAMWSVDSRRHGDTDHDRPSLDRLLASTLRATRVGRTCHLLVPSLDRLSPQPSVQQHHIERAHRRGGDVHALRGPGEAGWLS